MPILIINVYTNNETKRLTAYLAVNEVMPISLLANIVGGLERPSEELIMIWQRRRDAHWWQKVTEKHPSNKVSKIIKSSHHNIITSSYLLASDENAVQSLVHRAYYSRACHSHNSLF
jgi:hypothetical protein